MEFLELIWVYDQPITETSFSTVNICQTSTESSPDTYEYDQADNVCFDAIDFAISGILPFSLLLFYGFGFSFRYCTFFYFRCYNFDLLHRDHPSSANAGDGTRFNLNRKKNRSHKKNWISSYLLKVKFNKSKFSSFNCRNLNNQKQKYLFLVSLKLI